MKKIVKGYLSLFREMLGLRNDGSFLSPPAGMLVLIIICGIIGLLRNAQHVAFDNSSARFYSDNPAVLWTLGIRPKFYSFDPDLLWTMFNFPIYLFLWPAALLHLQLYLLGYRGVGVTSIFALSFNLQVLHLIVPVVDWLGFEMGLPWAYTFGPQKVATAWYLNYAVMTPGILVAWWLTGYTVAKVLRQRLGIGWPAVILTSLTTFLVIFFPTYLFFPTFNTLFTLAFGELTWNPQDPRLGYPILIHWGYGIFFALASLLGLLYYLKRRSTEST